MFVKITGLKQKIVRLFLSRGNSSVIKENGKRICEENRTIQMTTKFQKEILEKEVKRIREM